MIEKLEVSIVNYMRAGNFRYQEMLFTIRFFVKFMGQKKRKKDVTKYKISTKYIAELFQRYILYEKFIL